jgi:hypothetical protein
VTLWSRLAAYSCGGSCGLSPVLLERALPHSLSILLRGTAASTVTRTKAGVKDCCIAAHPSPSRDRYLACRIESCSVRNCT